MENRNLIAGLIFTLACGIGFAATPPELVNYQGVLRDATGSPIDGSEEMVFQFYDADGGITCVGGTLLLSDSHVGGGAVVVSGGQFNVQLGSGVLTPGSESTLADAFRNNANVYVEVEVGGETLCPRIRVVSAAYALNAGSLEGKGSADFIDTSSTAQSKAGPMSIATGTDLAQFAFNSRGVEGHGVEAGGYFEDHDNLGYAYLGYGDYGIAAGPDASIERNLEVGGELFFYGGSPAFGRVLTSDGTGWATWQDPSTDADTLDGMDSNEFINTSSSAQTKSGPLVADSSLVAGSHAVEGYGADYGGYFRNGSGVVNAYLGGYNGTGLWVESNATAGYFDHLYSTGEVSLAGSDWGIEVRGSSYAGFFDNMSGCNAYIAYNNNGIEATGYVTGGHFTGENGIKAYGSSKGGYFYDTDDHSQAELAIGAYGIIANGSTASAYFPSRVKIGSATMGEMLTVDGFIESTQYGFKFPDGSTQAISAFEAYRLHAEDGSPRDVVYVTADGRVGINTTTPGFPVHVRARAFFRAIDQSGYADLSSGQTGIEAGGNDEGGYFEDTDNSGYAYLGYGDLGIDARGNIAGGYFDDLDGSGYAYVAYGDYGIEARGNTAGGYFRDADGTGFAYIGYGPYGVHGEGNTAGGYFRDANSLGYSYVGRSTKGIEAHGTTIGGDFSDDNSTGRAYVAYGNRGIEAWGSEAGGYFYDDGSSGEAYVGYGDVGIEASGSSKGGYFHDSDHTGTANVGYGNTGIEASGSLQGGYFADTDGSWVRSGFSTYKDFGTGTPSFVQNHPYDEGRVIVYAAPEGDEVATYTRGTARLVDGRATVQLGETFKWVTNPDVGLTAHLTPREEPAVLAVESLSTSELTVLGPDGSGAEFDYIVYGLRIGFEEVSVVQEKDLQAYIPNMKDHRELYDRSPELRSFNSLERYRRMHAAVGRGTEVDLSAANALRDAIGEFNPEIHSLELNRPVQPSGQVEDVALEREEAIESEAAQEPSAGTSGVEVAHEDPAPGVVSTPFPIGGQVEAGDILVLDETQSGALRPADTASDRTVVGIAVAEASEIDGQLQVDVALHGVVDIKVDANYGAIMAGDLLTTSPTAGHAMLAIAPAQGSVAAKALESIDSGTGTIRALVIHQ